MEDNFLIKRIYKIIYVFILITLSISLTACTYSNSTSNTNNGKQITIVFDKQGGIGGSDYITVISPYGSTPSMPSATAPSKEGFVFKGYYLKSNGKGQQYYTSNMTSFRNWQYTVGKTLYARWLPLGAKSENVELNNNNFWDYFENNEALGNAYWYNIKPSNEDIVKNTFGTISLTLYVYLYSNAWSNQVLRTYTKNIILSQDNNYSTGRTLLIPSGDLQNKYNGYSTSISNVLGSITY